MLYIKARAIQETKKGRAGKPLDKRVMMMGCGTPKFENKIFKIKKTLNTSLFVFLIKHLGAFLLQKARSGARAFFYFSIS
ncbi:hypothetical protein B6D60_05300 [candidate division KSB1 bacterium 4484_87]|nr:MAG: hypothetical protein B6D60_05300 [candidate division KSB1 bacterium 4484_87]